MSVGYVSMYPCIECGEDVEARECYEDMGVLIHTVGVTGQAEPHETGSRPGDLKRVDIETFASADTTRLDPVQKLWHIREAHREYEAALKRREHGGVAAAHFVDAVEDVLRMP